MVKELLIFAGGVLLGSAATYLIVRDKYKREAQEEVDEVRSIYFEKCRRAESIRKMEDEKEEMKSTILKYGYSDLVNEDSEEIDTEDVEDQWEEEHIAPVEHPGDPYTITPHQFAYENRHYEKVTLLWYPSEKLLVSEIDGYEEDIDAAIGDDALTKFGEFEEDVVYVRNDRLGIDFEVIRQPDDEHYNLGDYDP